MFEQFVITTPLGKMIGLLSNKQLNFLKFEDCINWEGFEKTFSTRNSVQVNKQLQKQVDEYFAGERSIFNVMTQVVGTTFQEKTWHALSKIHYGQMSNYAMLAAQIGSPNSMRAIGNAVGANPIHLIVPCHRVIRSDGQLGGYAGGIERKKYLLELERKHKWQSS